MSQFADTAPQNVDQEQVRGRAYRLWEQEGCPDGRDQEFWYVAERQLQEEQAGSDGSRQRQQNGASEGIAPGPSGMEQTDDQDNLHNNVSDIGERNPAR